MNTPMVRSQLPRHLYAVMGALLLFASLFILGGWTDEQPQKSVALIPHQMDETIVAQNPYLPDAESMVHNDIYNSDVTAACMPLGIYSEIMEATAADSAFAPPAFFYDQAGNAIMPYNKVLEDGTILSGGIAIRDADDESLQVQGSYLPFIDDDGAKWGLQISYAFVDAQNYLVGPASNGHIVMIKTVDDNGEVLSTFEKVLDVDVSTNAAAQLGEDIDPSLLSIVYDYEGNIWFSSGGFRQNPAYCKTGYCGYLERTYIDSVLTGNTNLNAADYLHFMAYENFENVENAIAGHPLGCVILTNQNCYLFHADANNGVVQDWSVPYESDGDNKTPNAEKYGISGGPLAWGGGSSPTLTNDLVVFTDNQDVVNLYAIDIKTGEVVTTIPVLDLGEDVVVSVENSISVYSPNEELTSVLVCNWYGAGAAALCDPDANSSVQSYDNLYDSTWREKGSSELMPGVSRIDIVKQDDGTYKASTVWTRADLKDTCMIKLSTAAGYYYGYTQDETSGDWGFFALDYNTGETRMWIPVSNEAQYNNVAVGIMQSKDGNSVYCPTDSPVLVSIRDRFAYLPDSPEEEIDITCMKRSIIDTEEFQAKTDTRDTPIGYELSVSLDAGTESEILAFRVNGLTGEVQEYTVWYKNSQGAYSLAENAQITNENGQTLPGDSKLSKDTVYEVRVPISTTSDNNHQIRIVLTK